jgi:hypothetical protein
MMKNELFKSASDGFFGSFKLAAMLVIALVAVISGFINGEPEVENHPQSLPK